MLFFLLMLTPEISFTFIMLTSRCLNIAASTKSLFPSHHRSSYLSSNAHIKTMNSETSFPTSNKNNNSDYNGTDKLKNIRLTLGSGSSSRRQILFQAGYEDIVINKPDIDEKSIGDRKIGTFENAQSIVLSLGLAKADAILKSINTYSNDNNITSIADKSVVRNILITADQVILCNNKILEKPESVDQAKEFITMYNQHPCQTIGSIVLTDLTTNTRVSGIDTSLIYFKTIPDSIVKALLDEGKVMNCAGGLMIEHELIQPYIDRIDGSIDSVMGFSMTLFDKLLASLID